MNILDLSNPESRRLPDLIRQQAQEIPSAQFLLSDTRSYTFAEADQESDLLAGGLHGLGVRAEDRVAYYLDNRCETVILALATNKLAAVWVPICTDYKGEWLADSIVRSRPKVLVTETKYRLLMLLHLNTYWNQQLLPLTGQKFTMVIPALLSGPQAPRAKVKA